MKILFFIILCLFWPIIAWNQTKLDIQGKASIVTHYLSDIGKYPETGLDTLIDLNGDCYPDILIESYSLNATGEGNGVDIVMYDPVKKMFDTSAIITLPNPSFNFKNRTVTSYYIGNGGGYAIKYEWKGYSLRLLEEYDIKITETPTLSFNFNYVNKTTGKIKKWKKSFIALPEEYKYLNYKNLIKKNRQ